MADPLADQKLAAILAADVAGYSALMGQDERATVSEAEFAVAVVDYATPSRSETGPVSPPPVQTASKTSSRRRAASSWPIFSTAANSRARRSSAVS